MSETVRCPACRGAKKVPKLGGMIGECNMCEGKGNILASDKPVKADAVSVVDVISRELVLAVADCVPASTVEADVKVDGKKALYKRKKG